MIFLTNKLNANLAVSLANLAEFVSWFQYVDAHKAD